MLVEKPTFAARASRLERRAYSTVSKMKVDSRGSKTEMGVLRGHAAVFNSLIDMGQFHEQVAPGAFKRTLAEGADVRALIDHDPSQIVARTAAGTLRLWEDSQGLAVEIYVAPTQIGRDLIQNVTIGNVSQMSFAFGVRGELGEMWETKNGVYTRTLRDLDLFDVSCVTYPAYPATDLSVAERSLEAFKTTSPAHRAGRLLEQARGADVYEAERLRRRARQMLNEGI